MRKSSIAVIIGLTTLFGSNPDLKMKELINVEIGKENDNVIKIEIMGIMIRINGGIKLSLMKKISRKNAKNPIIIAVTAERDIVAKMF